MTTRYAEILDAALSAPDPAWAFCFMLRDVDRDAMDRFLVERQHPLAYEAGTQEGRFRTLYRAKYRFGAEG